jgi:hypothetical protein
MTMILLSFPKIKTKKKETLLYAYLSLFWFSVLYVLTEASNPPPIIDQKVTQLFRHSHTDTHTKKKT